MLVETLKRELKNERKEGIKIGEKQIIKQLLKNNIDIELIKKCTKLTDEELNALKNEII